MHYCMYNIIIAVHIVQICVMHMCINIYIYVDRDWYLKNRYIHRYVYVIYMWYIHTYMYVYVIYVCIYAHTHIYITVLVMVAIGMRKHHDQRTCTS